MVTTIGIDPHKATHTAVAINGSEMVLGELTVPADQHQTEKLIGWAGELDGGGRVCAQTPRLDTKRLRYVRLPSDANDHSRCRSENDGSFSTREGA